MSSSILLLIIITLLLFLVISQLLNWAKGSDQSFNKIRDEVRIHQNRNETILREEFSLSRNENAQNAKLNSELIGQKLTEFGTHQSTLLKAFQKQLLDNKIEMENRLKDLTQTTNKSLTDIRLEINQRLESIQKDNNAKLEKMRETVDEKLHKTLEERLGHSFKLVSDSLDKVQKGLGEMQSLAHGVGDLKKVLSNVKTRGVLGEIQLGNILEQILTPDQYGLNVATIPNSSNHVEFAIKFPGKDNNQPVWLPVDSKFPLDRYEQLLSAYETGNHTEIEQAQKDMIRTVKLMAKDICDKYISPPNTTDFGVLFLPIEGLYAEVVRHPGLMEILQRDYRIMVAGPTNLAAFLNSLNMGFRSLAIEKRSSEVWKILSAVKSEFGKFGDVLSKTQKKLQEASSVINKAETRTRAIERKLRDVEQLPESSSISALE
jgi:DNA recombination protein RmuC